MIAADEGCIWDVSVSTDGRSLVTAGDDSLAKLWDISTGELIQDFKGHRDGLASARFSPDGKQLLTASDDETVRLWDVKSGQQLYVFTDHSNTVWRAVFSPDGKLIASSSFHGEILLWETASRTLVNRLDAHSDQTAGLTFSNDGRQLVSSSDDGSIKFWDVESLKRKDNANAEIIVLTDQPNKPAVHVSFSSDGNKLLSGGFGSVTIRSAVATTQDRPFLIEESKDLLNQVGIIMAQYPIPEKDIDQAMEGARECCKFFPSFETFTFLGQTQYLRGQLSEAKVSLEEAHRLQQISYRHPDLHPMIEGLLALVYLKTGDTTAGKKMMKLFQTKYDEGGWNTDKHVKNLQDELVKAHREITPAKNTK